MTAPFLIVTALLLSQPATPFKIVVLAGEDSVNVIQQKTAVAPLVEVRDRNNNPVSGAVVTFAVQGGKAAAFQGGATTITVATNAAGQAAAAGFTPLAAGAVNISVEAAIQGQVVTAAITQVNVMTAAEAAAAGASGAAAGGGAAGGGAAGGGGGISGTTVGIVGAVAAAGAVAATRAGGSGGEAATSTRPSPTVFRSPFSMNVTLVFGGCSRQETYAGTLTLTLESTSPTVTGKAEFGPGLGTGTVIASTCPQPVGPIGTGWSMPSGPVTGTESSMVFNSSDVVRTLDNNGDTFARSFIFTGALSGNTITGQIHMVWRHSTPTFPLMDMQTAITLTKQ